MKKFQAKRMVHAKRIRISDGYASRLVTENDLKDICGYSQSQANRIINGKCPLPDSMRELLLIKLIGKIPDFPNGFYVIDGEISCPNGFMVSSEHMENFSFFMQIMNDMCRDIKRLTKKNLELEAQLKHRSEIRVYHNDEKEHRRVLKLVK